jgi:hypothetical protein
MFTHYIYIFYSCITQIVLIMLIVRIPAYNEAREQLKLRLVFLNELKIEVLRFGDDTLNEMQNLQIFKSNEQNVLPMYDHNTPPHRPPPKYIFD